MNSLQPQGHELLIGGVASGLQLEVRLLFEGGDYFTDGGDSCGVYSRVATIRGQRLIEEIRYVAVSELAN